MNPWIAIFEGFFISSVIVLLGIVIIEAYRRYGK